MSTESARAIEAILMVAQEPVDPHLLAQLLEVAPSVIEEICTGLADAYEAEGRGFVLVKVAGGYRFQSHADLAAYVERFVLEGQSARLSSAALETLAIVAYKQPLSRAQVAAIRGVNVDGVMRTLQQRGYVEEVGRDSGPGQATLFGTSAEFLERMGLASIEDLPDIAALFPSAEIMEALEKTLRATPEVDEPATLPLGDATPTPADAEAHAVAAAHAAEIQLDPDIVLADVEFPEPEPPAWAVSPEAAEPAPEVVADGPNDDPTEPGTDDPAEP